MSFKGKTIKGQEAVQSFVKQHPRLMGHIRSDVLLDTVGIEIEHSSIGDPGGAWNKFRFIDKDGTVIGFVQEDGH